MTSNYSDFFTPTMAKIYASQGYLEEAVRIYTHISEKFPDREDLKESLLNLKDRIANLQDYDLQVEKSEIPPVFEEWVTLLLRYGHILKLRNILEGLNQQQHTSRADN